MAEIPGAYVEAFELNTLMDGDEESDGEGGEVVKGAAISRKDGLLSICQRKLSDELGVPGLKPS